MNTKPSHVCLIDGSNMMHRAFAMARPVTRSADGLEVGSVYLFSQMMGKLLERMSEGRKPPSHAAIFFDPSREASWRREVHPDYKAHRPELEEHLRAQVPLIHEVCRDTRIGFAVAPRHEADDLIGAYCEDAVALGARVSIISNDKDLMQLVRPGVLQLNTVQDKWYGVEAVEQKFGVPPSLVADFLAMAGDSVDGITGAKGIGPKSAAVLLNTFGSLAGILTNTSEIERKSWKKIIEAHRGDLRMSRLLTGLDSKGAPRPLGWDEMRLAGGGYRSAARRWREENL